MLKEERKCSCHSLCTADHIFSFWSYASDWIIDIHQLIGIIHIREKGRLNGFPIIYNQSFSQVIVRSNLQRGACNDFYPVYSTRHQHASKLLVVYIFPFCSLHFSSSSSSYYYVSLLFYCLILFSAFF